MKMECPVCGEKYDKQGLENHMRLTNGKGHGPAGEYPPEPGEEITRFDPSEYMVDVSVGDETREMSLQDAVELSHDMIMDPENFGLASGQQVRELEREIEGLQSEIEELRGLVSVLAGGQVHMMKAINDASGVTGSPNASAEEWYEWLAGNGFSRSELPDQI